MYVNESYFPFVLPEHCRGRSCTRPDSSEVVAGGMGEERAGRTGANLNCGRVSGIWLSYQKTSTSRINCSIANAGSPHVKPAVRVRDMGHTGMPTGVRDRVCAQDTLVRTHPMLSPGQGILRQMPLRPLRTMGRYQFLMSRTV